MRGTYILLIKNRKGQRMKIGRLGTFYFPAGINAYVGSAFGKSVNLENRIGRHLSNRKRLFWHIDYFLDSRDTEITDVRKFPDKRIECELAREFLKRGRAVAGKFGSSDCGCESHLIYFGKKNHLQLPSPEQISE